MTRVGLNGLMLIGAGLNRFAENTVLGQKYSIESGIASCLF